MQTVDSVFAASAGGVKTKKSSKKWDQIRSNEWTPIYHKAERNSQEAVHASGGTEGHGFEVEYLGLTGPRIVDCHIGCPQGRFCNTQLFISRLKIK